MYSYNATIHFANDHTKTFKNITQYNFSATSVRLKFKDYKSVTVPFNNVNYIELESERVEEK